MFGLRLKSWMETHLGRSRQKSGQQNQKSHRGTTKEKDAGNCSSAAGATSSFVGSEALLSPPSNYNPQLTGHNLGPQDSSNPDSSKLSLSPTTHPSINSSVQIQSELGGVGHTAQLLNQEEVDQPPKDYEEKVGGQVSHHHHQPSTCTRSSTTGSVSNSTSHNNILLGAFCNNLSSPDTGYSTDGYSPKSVYPALSFESSGKSTPKSSYTISSLVSSELQLSTFTSKGNTATHSLSSASCSINNGLDSDHDHIHNCGSPSSVQQPYKLTSSSSPCRAEGKGKSGEISCLVEDKHLLNQHQHSVCSHSISHKSQPLIPSIPSTNPFRSNETVTGPQSISTDPSSITHSSEFSLHHQSSGGNGRSSMVTANHTLSNFAREYPQDHLKGCNSPPDNEHSRIFSTNPFLNNGNQIQTHGSSPSSSFSAYGNPHHNHRRTESFDERRSSINSNANSDSDGNSSCLVTGSTPGSSTNRNINIRTSFVLVTSQIPECNGLSLKNAYSICSPRKERTRIRTNPYFAYKDHNGRDVNSNANNAESSSEDSANAAAVDSSRVGESDGMHHRQFYMNQNQGGTCPLLLPSGDGGVSMRIDSQPLSINDCSSVQPGINNLNNNSFDEEKEKRKGDSSLCRISTSCSASDSGKGSFDLDSGVGGTNRNSTESSCILSDSASTRNSIISQEIELTLSHSSSLDSASCVPLQEKTGEKQQSARLEIQSHHQGVSSSSSKPVKVNGNSTSTGMAVSCESAKNSPAVSVKNISNKCIFLQNSNDTNNMAPDHNNSYHEDRDTTSASITLPPELVTTVSVSAQTNVIMVDKETDILSDWNTDDDGEDELETDRNEDEDEDDEDDLDADRMTPTVSSTPDTDIGGREEDALDNSQSNHSSVTDIDFGDSSAATAASSTGIAPSSSIFRHHYTQNPKIPSVTADPCSIRNIMHSDSTCYQSVPIRIQPATGPQYHKGSSWSQPQSDTFVRQGAATISSPTRRGILGFGKSGVMRPKGQPVGIPATNVSLSSLYSYDDGSEEVGSSDYNANNKRRTSSTSTAITRGALGFLRKIFKKGSCSSSKTSPGSDKGKVPRSRKSKSSNLDNIASITGLRSNLVTADALVSPYPLVARKQSINGYFLTPTPNAFRRRSTTGTDSSESKSSTKHNKPVKSDIIRLLPTTGPLSPTQLGQNNLRNTTSSSTSSSKYTTGSFPYTTGKGNGNNHGHNTNTNSTASSMSTSTSLSGGGDHHANANTPSRTGNQSRLNGDFYSNSSCNRHSPFKSEEALLQYPTSGCHTHSNLLSNKPQMLSPLPASPTHQQHPINFATTADVGIINIPSSHHHPHEKLSTPPSRIVGPYESPRLQIHNPQHRINSPSFNNYSPIHRLVVTGGSHLLNQPPPPNPPKSASHFHPSSDSSSLSPHLPTRPGGGGRASQNCNNNNNNNSPSTFTPNINRSRSSHSNNPSPSPLINHHHQSSVSSPKPHILPTNGLFTASPSPVLRNPRYQYITSSNQNSPILNAPKRINLPPPHNQHYYHNNHQEGHEGPFPNGHPQHHQPLPSFSTFSPKAPPKQSKSSNNNPFSTASPDLHQHKVQNKGGSANHHPRQHRNLELGETNPLPNPTNTSSTSSSPGRGSSVVPVVLPTMNKNNNAISRSQSYQNHSQSPRPQPIHYYASPVVQQQHQIQTQQPPQVPQRILHPQHPPTSLNFNEPPLLMKAHLHNQNVRLNNFLMSKQRHQQNALGHAPFPTSHSAQERIYESVDSEEDEEEQEEEGQQSIIGFEEEINSGNHNHHFYYTNRNGHHDPRINRLPGAISDPPESYQFPNKGNQNSKSARSKGLKEKSQAENVHPMFQPPRPPVPMSLFGPNTFLSETETRLLEADREAEAKFKRLINEAEALLREISVVKSQQPSWLQRERERAFLRAEECPQSDPLKRKAYDCWALRRLQQELAGCCASPPVLHRSRMNLQSPGTPTTTTAIHPYFSTVGNTNIPNNPTFTDNQNQNNNVHF